MSKQIAKMLSPEFLGELESERNYSNNLYTRTPRIKLEKGESCLIRVLPVAMGKSGSYTARIAQHWMNKKPVVCPRFTHPDFGGDPKAHCPACETTDEAYDLSTTDEERQFAKDCSVKVKWLSWCLLFEHDNGRKVEVMQPPEVWVPHEFSMSKTTFDELSILVQRSARSADNPLGILDFERGCDLWVTRAANNTYRLDKADSGPTPIATVDGKFNALVEQILSECKTPTVHVASQEALDNFALKFADALASLSGRGRRGAGRSSRGDEDSPRSRRGDDGGDRSSRDDDGDAPATRRSFRAQEFADEPASRRQDAAPEQEPALRSSRRQAAQEAAPQSEAASVPRRSVAQSAPAQQAADDVPYDAPTARSASQRPTLSRLPADEPPPSRAPQAMPSRRGAESPEDPEDTAPEEARDPVPPASDDLPDDGKANAFPDRSPGAGGSALSQALRRNIGVLGRKAGA